MNFQLVKTIQSDFEGMCNVFDRVEEIGLYKNPFGQFSLRKVLELDIAGFLMFLSASDGVIDEEEVELYQAVTGYTDSVDEIVDFIVENNIYSAEFESTIPISMKVAVEAERNYHKIMEMDHRYTFPGMLYNLYERIGKALIGIDGSITAEERRDYSVYLTNLKEYISRCGF